MIDTMRRDVCEMRNVSKSWADICKDNNASSSPIMQTLVQAKNEENVDMQELQERKKRLENIVIHGSEQGNIPNSCNCY